jgi:hypothetical protein
MLVYFKYLIFIQIVIFKIVYNIDYNYKNQAGCNIQAENVIHSHKIFIHLFIQIIMPIYKLLLYSNQILLFFSFFSCCFQIFEYEFLPFLI